MEPPRERPVVPREPSPAGDPPEVLARFHAELDLVDLVARQVGRRIARAITLDDLRSFGREGLLQAARSFDAARGVPFRRWANLRIRGAMIDGVRQWGGLPRRVYRELKALEAGDRVVEAYDEENAARPAPTPEGADGRLTAYLTGMATAMALVVATPTTGHEAAEVEAGGDSGFGATPEELVGGAEVARKIRAVVAKLPDRERSLIERHYFGGETLEAAGASLGLSKSWASRLHARAIENLGKELGKLGLA